MKLIVGLGNPGRKYELTRHNVGWWVVDHLADVWRFTPWRSSGDSLIADGRIGTLQTRLMKPHTFMNLSGTALRPYARRTTWRAAEDLLVIVDEVALPVGTLRLRPSGSAGGHNGLKSIEATLGSQEYARLRVGIGPHDGDQRVGDLADFVLDRAGKAERHAIAELYPLIETGIQTWAADGAVKAANVCNKRPAVPREGDNPDKGSPDC